MRSDVKRGRWAGGLGRVPDLPEKPALYGKHKKGRRGLNGW